jgi:anti-sigma factor ChrR (cupin superfamily)
MTEAQATAFVNAQVAQLLEKLQALPPERRAEVEDFVDFLAAKTRKQAAFDRLLAIPDQLAAAGVETMTEEEINAEIKAARAERRARADRP